MRPVEIEIDHLVLEGVPPGQADEVARAVEEELARLLSGQELPTALLHDRETRYLAAQSAGLDAGSGARRIGARVARALSGALRQ